jgi:signal transduction histidine kinase
VAQTLLEAAGLRDQDFDALLLDLTLPDSQGLETVRQARGLFPSVPLVVLTGVGDEQMALDAILQGAQDYLVKGQSQPELIYRSVQYAIARRAAQYAQERERLAYEVLAATEREQQRIGQDLHDGVQGSLAGVSLMLMRLVRQAQQEHLLPSQLAHTLIEVNGYLKDTIGQIRNLSKGLCPELKMQGLNGALTSLAGYVGKMSGKRCEFSGDAAELDRSPAAAQLYFIAQEAVANALKHADANCIFINAACQGGHLQLTVEDDGAGIDPQLAAGGLGLRAMDYRARMIGAQLEIASREGGGTRISCRLPLSPQPS